MVVKGPLLSICIPTYNREKYLKRLLDSIICQKEFLDTDDVEIVVDDGPSSDNTESMVKEYIKKYGNKIKYYRNPIRIGMCPAFLEALSLGNGKYSWLFGSDDFMAPNVLGNILNYINEYNPKVIYSRRKEVNFGDKVEKNIEKTKILSFNGMSEFSKYLGDNARGTFHDKDVFFTFISILCINSLYYRESYNYLINIYSERELKENYFNFSFVGLGNIENDTIGVVDNPICVYCELDNHGWKPNRKISRDLSKLIDFIKNRYSITLSCKIFFMKMNVLWRLNCNVIPYMSTFLKKIGLFNIISKIYKRVFS